MPGLLNARQPTYENIVYAYVETMKGEKIPLYLDLYLPVDRADPAPVVMWIHGGGYNSRDHKPDPEVPTFHEVILSMVDKGVAVAAVQYRYSYEAIFPAQIHDLKGAVRFLRAHASEYGIDSQRIGVWGNCTGGHMAALLAASYGVEELEGDVGGNLEYPSYISAAVVVYGICDLLNMVPDYEPDVLSQKEAIEMHESPGSFIGQILGFDGPGQGMGVLRELYINNRTDSPYWPKVQLALLANPITHITSACAPILLGHGYLDKTVPIKQSLRLFYALCRAGVDAHFISSSKRGHGKGLPKDMNAYAVQWLLKHLT